MASRRGLAWPVWGLVWMAVGLWSVPASAGNEEEQLLGPGAAMTAGAVTATTNEGSAILYNPAGLAHIDVATLDITTNAFVLRTYDAPELLSGPVSIDSEGGFTEFVSVPAGLTFVRPINDNLRLGLGVFSTRSRNITLRNGVSLPLEDDDLKSTFLVVFRESEATTEIGASIAWKVSSSLRLGATLALSSETYSSMEMFGSGVTDEEGDEVTSADQTFNLFESQTLSASPIFGVQWDVGPVTLGASLRVGRYYIVDTTEDVFMNLSLIPDEEEGSFGFVDIEEPSSEQTFGLGLESTSRARLGVAYRWDKGHVALDGDVFFKMWDDGSGSGKLPNFNVRLGTQIEIAKHMTVGAGVFSDRSMEGDIGLLADYDVDLYGGTLGIRYGDERLLAEKEEFPLMGFETSFALRYAQGSGTITGLRLPDDLGVDGGTLEEEEGVKLTLREIGFIFSSGVYF